MLQYIPKELEWELRSRVLSRKMSGIVNRSYPPIIYSNINFGTQDVSKGPIPLSKYYNPGGNIVPDSSMYYVTVSKLVIPSSAWLWLPLLKLTGQNNPPTRTVYDFVVGVAGLGRVEYGNAVSVDLIRTDFTAQVPNVISGNLTPPYQPSDGYASVRSYYIIAEMLTNALQAAYFDACSICSNAPAPVAPSDYPRFVFNPNTESFELRCFPYSDWALDKFDSTVTGFSIFCSYEMLPLLKGFTYEILNSSPSTSRRDVRIILSKKSVNFWQYIPPVAPATIGTWDKSSLGGITNILTPDDPSSAMLVYQQGYSAPFVFQAMSSIIVTSSLPTLSEGLDAPLNANQNLNQEKQQVLANFSPILSTANDYAQMLVLNQDRQSRPVALASGRIDSFTIGVRWIDVNGVGHDLYSVPGTEAATATLVFTRRDLLENYY